VEAFGLDVVLAHHPEAALATMLGGVLLECLLGSLWGWEDEELAVGEDSINVEKEKLDFLGSLSGHGRILAS